MPLKLNEPCFALIKGDELVKDCGEPIIHELASEVHRLRAAMREDGLAVGGAEVVSVVIQRVEERRAA